MHAPAAGGTKQQQQAAAAPAERAHQHGVDQDGKVVCGGHIDEAVHSCAHLLINRRNLLLNILHQVGGRGQQHLVDDVNDCTPAGEG